MRIAIAALAFSASAAGAQPVVQSGGPSSRTPVIIMDTDTTGRIIRGVDTLAIVSNSMRKAHMQALVDLNEQRRLRAVDSVTIARQQEVIDAGARALARDSALIIAQRAQIKDHEMKGALLEAKIRKLNPLISVEGGLGFNTGGLGAIGSVGLKRFRLWGTLQEKNSGLFGGLWFPVF